MHTKAQTKRKLTGGTRKMVHKLIKRNVLIALFIGMFFGWWWTRAIFSASGTLRIISMVIVGAIAAFLGYLDAIIMLKKKE